MTNSGSIDALLDYIRDERRFDFTGYKRSSLTRRIRKRMHEVDSDEYPAYLDFLQTQPEEFTQLFNTILINVTSFFRDSEAWQYLEQEILPKIISSRQTGAPIRVWCAGSSSGEEAYSTAILLAEALGEKDYRQRVKIYATDVDEEALWKARQAVYTEKEVESVPPKFRERYFEVRSGLYTFRKDLRRTVIFGRHDLIQDAPISHIDLLLCRNVLMYFNAETQEKVVHRLHFGLRDNGYIFLGKAEMLLAHSKSFLPIDIKYRIFRKVPNGIGIQRNRLTLLNNNEIEATTRYVSNLEPIQEAAFETGPEAQLVVDTYGDLVLANIKACSTFKLNKNDLGHPFHDLEISYRPVELRSVIDRISTELQPIIIKEIEWPEKSGENLYFELEVIPLVEKNSGELLAASITFKDVSDHKTLSQKLVSANQELETAMEELQSTNEELETTNEELQSTIEELETTNEELQSTNEELETMNEELQSTNQEMETVNDELTMSNQAYDEINALLSAIMASMSGGVVVLDENLRVQVWNKQMEELWGLRENEVLQRTLFNLDIQLPVDQLTGTIRKSLTGAAPKQNVNLRAINRRGREFDCLIFCAPLKDKQQNIKGVVIEMRDISESDQIQIR